MDTVNVAVTSTQLSETGRRQSQSGTANRLISIVSLPGGLQWNNRIVGIIASSKENADQRLVVRRRTSDLRVEQTEAGESPSSPPKSQGTQTEPEQVSPRHGVLHR